MKMNETYILEHTPIYDLIGIGIGPFNLSLAALAQPLSELKTIFFEQSQQFNWHPGIMLNESTLQVPFIADLVTLADPTSPFSFLNYLQKHNRLYQFYFHEKLLILRQEYNHYCQWVTKQLNNLKFGHQVIDVQLVKYKSNLIYKTSVKELYSQKVKQYYCKHLTLGIGTEPRIPKNFQHINHDNIQHSAYYLNLKSNLQQDETVCVIGSGQSAAEIILDLLNEYPNKGKKIIWATRSKGFFPMEYSKLGLEHFSPDYMDYFYNLNAKTRHDMIQTQDFMYKGISAETIADIYDKIYQLTIEHPQENFKILAQTQLNDIQFLSKDQLQLLFKHQQLQQSFYLNCHKLILATGYQARKNDFLQNIQHELITDRNQHYQLNHDFSIKMRRQSANKIFVQNNSLYSHGIGSPDLGLICHRNSIILNTLLAKQVYTVNTKTVFQNFGLPEINAKQQGYHHEIING